MYFCSFVILLLLGVIWMLMHFQKPGCGTHGSYLFMVVWERTSARKSLGWSVVDHGKFVYETSEKQVGRFIIHRVRGQIYLVHGFLLFFLFYSIKLLVAGCKEFSGAWAAWHGFLYRNTNFFILDKTGWLRVASLTFYLLHVLDSSSYSTALSILHHGSGAKHEISHAKHVTL